MNVKLEHVLLSAFTGAAIFLLVEAGLFVRDVRFKTIPELTQAVTEVRRTALITGVAAKNLQKASDSWKEKQDLVADQALAATSQLNSDLRSLDVLLFTANVMLERQGRSLESLEGQGTALLSHTDAQISNMSDAILPVAYNLQETTQNAASSTAALNSAILRIAPDIESTSRSTAQTATNVQDTTADVKSFVHRETTPVRGTWNVIKSFLFEIAGPAASVATSVK